MAGMYWELFWNWLRKGYLAFLIGDVFIPVPIWAVIAAAIALAFFINLMLCLMSNSRDKKISS